MRILLADDHAITREGTRRLLETEQDLEVIAEAADGAETVQLATDLKPDILLLDISMPRLSGVQVVKLLHMQAPEISIVVLTGYDTENYFDALFHMGVRGYLPKSTSSRELIDALREVHAGGVHIHSPVAAGSPQLLGCVDQAPTPRELEVLVLVGEGLSNAMIARRLGMSQRTVQFHVSHLFAKLDATSRTHVVYLARQQGWIN